MTLSKVNACCWMSLPKTQAQLDTKIFETLKTYFACSENLAELGCLGVTALPHPWVSTTANLGGSSYKMPLLWSHQPLHSQQSSSDTHLSNSTPCPLWHLILSPSWWSPLSLCLLFSTKSSLAGRKWLSSKSVYFPNILLCFPGPRWGITWFKSPILSVKNVFPICKCKKATLQN